MAVDETIPADWLRSHQHSVSMATLFTWKTGMFGFRLKKEIKAAENAHERLSESVSRLENELTELTYQLRDKDDQLQRLYKNTDGASSDPEIREVTLEIERIKESAEAKNDLLDDSREKRDIRWNDLQLMIAYKDGVYRVPKDYTEPREAGILATTDSKRARHKAPKALENPGRSTIGKDNNEE